VNRLELFFEAAAGGGQIRRIHQRHGVRLQPLPVQQPLQQMLIDPPQSAHADLLAKLMQHPRRRRLPAQPGEPPPHGLLRQLRHQQVQRMGRGQHRQQMDAPELGRTQGVAPATSKSAHTNLRNHAIRDIIRKPFQQSIGADRRQSCAHTQTLPESAALATPSFIGQAHWKPTSCKNFRNTLF